MTEMKRFDVAGCSGYCNGGYHMKEDVDGEYVTHESHVEAMKRIAGASAQQAEPATPLWMIHIEGPDDLVAAPTKKEAERIATAINAVHDNWATKRRAEIAASGGNPDHYPTTRTVVVPFDGPAQDHAASLAADWDGYVEYVEARAILAQAAPSASAQQAEPVAWRHSHTLCLYETREDVPLADGDEWAVPLYLAAPSASAQQAPVDLTGLADRLLAPREIVRNEDGHLFNPAFPILDEGDDVRMFLGAFGIECCQVSMESDCDDEALRDAVWDGEKGCGEWTPTPPAGDGWMLSDIFDTEDGPYALFIRRKPKEPKKSRRERYATPSPAALTETELRAEFEYQHKGRNLKQHRLRGTYVSAPIAALWNQHKRTAIWMQSRAMVAATVTASPADQVEDARDAARLTPCKGMNCGCTDGLNHSVECQAEHAAAIAGGRFVK